MRSCPVMCKRSRGQKLRSKDVGERKTASLEISHSVRESWNDPSITQCKGRKVVFPFLNVGLLIRISSWHINNSDGGICLAS